MKKHIGKTFLYRVSTGEVRRARCIGIKMNHVVGKPLFIGVSLFGNEVKLTKNEILKFF